MRKIFLVLSFCLLFFLFCPLNYNSQEYFSFRRIHRNLLITDPQLLDEAYLLNILHIGGGLGSIVVDARSGEHIARLSISGKRIISRDGFSVQDILKGIEEGRFVTVTHQELVQRALEHRENCVLVFTGGGDSAGINAVISSAVQGLKKLKPEMTVLGLRNAGASLVVSPEEFPEHLVLIDELYAEDVAEQGSTFLGSSRYNPFKKAEDMAKTLENIKGFGAWISTGGDDNLKVAQRLSQENPEMVVLATAKTIDGDVMVNGRGVQCLGFDSAAKMYRDEIYSIAQSAKAHGEKEQPLVIVVEVFGRDSGRLAFESARPDDFSGLNAEEIRRQVDLAGTIMIVVPEEKHADGTQATIDELVKRAEEIIARENAVVIVVAEGYRPGDMPDIVKTSSKTDAYGHVQLAGIGSALVPVLEKRIPKAKVRTSLLNYEGRGTLPSEYDVTLGYKIGWEMAELIAQGVTGGRFVGYFNEMDARFELPVVLELVNISNQNTLELYPRQILERNRVLVLDR
ncbi:MAG: 6-phosphofructokinase [Candidatus Omnitrophica bacterium]|nr:6-phosphofructokinase [Candidatus Omnitrophota bacterium]